MSHRCLATIALVDLVGLALATLILQTQGEAAQVQTELTWRITGDLNNARAHHTATLLPEGRVLVAGGRAAPTSQLPEIGSAELFDRGLGFMDAWRPVLTSATSPLPLGTPLSATGSQFRGISEASGSNSAQNSPTDYPLVQLHRLDNDQTRFLLPDPSGTWSNTSFTSVPVTDFPAGHALVTVFTNGIPSISNRRSSGLPSLGLMTRDNDEEMSTGLPL
jgi:hypothetical protein